MEYEFKIGDIVYTPLGVSVEIYELFTQNGEELATGKFKDEYRWKCLTFPASKLVKAAPYTPINTSIRKNKHRKYY
jgi:hypothetical protein